MLNSHHPLTKGAQTSGMVPPSEKSLMQLSPQSPLKAGLSWLWRCPLVPHLKASNSEAAGVVGRGDHGHQEGAVGDVLLVELHRDLVVSCWETEEASFPEMFNP